MKVDRIANKNKGLNAFISIAEDELNAMMNEGKGGDFFELKAWVESSMRFTIDPMRTTVGEFFSYVKLIQSRAKQANAE